MRTVRPSSMPAFLAELMAHDASRSALRSIAEGVPNMFVFEAVAKGDITAKEGAEILMLKREAEPWPVRFFRWLFISYDLSELED